MKAYSNVSDYHKPDELSLTLMPASLETSRQRTRKFEQLTTKEIERSTLTSLMSFAKICLLKCEQYKEVLLASTNYKTYVHGGRKSRKLTKNKCLNDMSAGPHLVNESFYHPTWTLRTKRRNMIKLSSANRGPKAHWEWSLQLQVSGLLICVQFEVVKNLALYLLLGEPFIHKYIRGIFPAERKKVPWHL